jgi:hypothetical protein
MHFNGPTGRNPFNGHRTGPLIDEFDTALSACKRRSRHKRQLPQTSKGLLTTAQEKFDAKHGLSLARDSKEIEQAN